MIPFPSSALEKGRFLKRKSLYGIESRGSLKVYFPFRVLLLSEEKRGSFIGSLPEPKRQID
jgi:hypothetical protein